MILGRNGFVSVGDISNASVDPSRQRPANFPPTKPVFPFPVAPPLRKVDQQQQSKGTSPGADPSGTGGIPFVLLSLSAVQSPVKEQTQVVSLITVSWTQQSDPNFDHVNIWIVGYHGSTNPQLVASGSTAPINFTLDATGETISLYAQTASSSGDAAPILFAAHTTVTLSGNVGAPPPPIINQALVGTSTGYQFSFNQVVLPSNDEEIIACYKIYRSTSNTFSSAVLLQTIIPTPNLTGSIVVTDVVVAATGASYYYWVSAVNTAGFESTPTPTGPAVGSIGSTPFSITSNFSFSSDSSSITWSWSSFQILRADGTSTTVGTGSQVISGLAASTTYWFFPYWDETTQAIAWVASGSGTPAYAQSAVTLSLLQAMNLRTHIPLAAGGMSAATTASGTGGGTGGGGGGGGGGRQFYIP